MDLLRTPEERFTDLPDFPFAPHYVDVPADPSGEDSQLLRMHYLDEGPRTGPPVLLLHGEPSWCFLYRTMIPPLVAAGVRVIAPDLPGFGRSDKPAAAVDYTYARLVAWTRAAVFDTLGLDGVTLFCQDWGGLVGLRLVGEHPERFAGVVASNTGLPDGKHRMPEVWWAFHDFVGRTVDLPIGMLVTRGCATDPGPAVAAAYEAPFPDPSFKVGARTLPGLIPQSPEDVATPAQQAAWESLRRFDRPFVTAFSDGDPITRGNDRPLQQRIPGAAGQPHITVPGGHFVQEDSGPALAEMVAQVALAARG